MKSSKKAIQWTRWIIFILLILIISIYVNTDVNKEGKLFYDLVMTCFGSALFGMVISFTNYMTKRQSTMEYFYEESVRAYNVIANIPDLGFPINLTEQHMIADYIKAKEIGEKTQTFTNGLRNLYLNDGGTNESSTYWNIDDKKSRHMVLTDEQRQQYAEAKMARLPHIRDQIIIAASYMVNMLNTDLSALHRAYGQLDFLHHNLDIKDHLAAHIYCDINSIKDYCLKHQDTIKTYEKTGNVGDCAYDVLFLSYALFHSSIPNPWGPTDGIEMLHSDIDKFYDCINKYSLDRILKIDSKSSTPSSNIGARDYNSIEKRIEDIRKKEESLNSNEKPV